MRKKKVAYIINHLSFFVSHILPLALEAKRKKYEIKIFCGNGGSKEMEIAAIKKLTRHKINFKNIGFFPGEKNILFEFKFLVKFILELKKYNPDIIHGISLKGVLYSCIYSRIFQVKKLIFFITGLGHFFTNKLRLYEICLKNIILFIIKLSLKSKNALLILENKTDKNYFLNKLKIQKSKIVIFDGAGVDLKKFNFNEKKEKIILFPARVLVEKGINEFLKSSKILSKKYPNWKFYVAGTLNYKKNQEMFINLENSGLKNIKFLGYHRQIHKLFNKSSIVCLPSYREGFPKSLIEGSASGCAIVTTNVVGCRDAIINNFNGFLCKPKNVKSLVNQLNILIKYKKTREIFAKNSRKLAMSKYDVKIFIRKNLVNYNY
jgi:glycosyltransferase involved in cell wall biosynthesis